MQITALGYRTDVMARSLEGSEVADRGGYLAVRTLANPGFWWGNFLVIPPPAPGETAMWLGRFAAALPGAKHVALAVDTPRASALDAAECLSAGLTLERAAVLTAEQVREPGHASQTAVIRTLADDDDWRQSARLRIACQDQAIMTREQGDVLRRRVAQSRALTDTGHGTWFGAFHDGDLVAQLGIVWDGEGLVRYQDVETHPAARRQGLAGALVSRAARHALARGRARTLVIVVADPGSEAMRLYQSLGFAEAEEQVGLIRRPAGS